MNGAPSVGFTWSETAAVAATSLAMFAGPVIIGGLIGRVLQGLLRRRVSGAFTLAGMLLGPMLAGGAAEILNPMLGVWDGLLEGLLVGVGFAWAGHTAFSERRRIVLMLMSTAGSLVLFELAARVLLPQVPGFPVGAPHLLLEDAISHAFGPGDATDRQVVCSLLYGDQYEGLFYKLADTLEMPTSFTPGSGRHVLHIGDSMVYGAGVDRTETFVADLKQLEPDVQHINGGIPGTGPDAYLVMLRSWISRQRIDLAVWYLFELNDFNDIDTPYPCSDWKSLFVYGADGPRLRFPEKSHSELAHAGWTWLLANSPPPYLTRILVRHSAAAAWLAATLADRAARGGGFSETLTNAEQRQRLTDLLRAARDELAARHVPFVVVVLPSRASIEHHTEGASFTDMLSISKQLGIRTLDATEPVAKAYAGGEKVFLRDDDCHFNPTGHQIMAKWLHERFAEAR